LDGVRIGSAHPDPNGRVEDGGLSVPGDASPGHHTLWSSCHSPGKPVEQAMEFEVAPSHVHRSGLVTSLPTPRQVDFSPKAILTSAAVTVSMLFLIAFPFELFNSTLEEHYNEIRGWFGLAERRQRAVHRKHQVPVFLGFLALGGVLYALLDPRIGFNRSSLALVVGIALSLAVVTLGFSLPTILFMRHRFRERGELQVLHGTILVAAICVGVSRVLHIQPGYIYGLIGGFVFSHHVAKRIEGRLVAVSSLIVLVFSLAAWVASIPVSESAAKPHAAWWLIALEACLATTFVLGIESNAFGMLPLRGLAGAAVTAWSRFAWTVVFGIGAFTFVHILLRPGSGYVADPRVSPLAIIVGANVTFGVLSVAFWAYFRFRGDRTRDEASSEVAGRW
jgi:hypothetical protein